MPPVSLSSLRKGARGVVADVRDDAQSLGDEARSTVSRRLLELGFIPGEAVEVISEVWPPAPSASTDSPGSSSTFWPTAITCTSWYR